MPITFPFLLLHPTLGSINPCSRSLLVSPLIHFPLPSSITIPMLLCLGCPFIRFLSLAHPMHAPISIKPIVSYPHQPTPTAVAHPTSSKPVMHVPRANPCILATFSLSSSHQTHFSFPTTHPTSIQPHIPHHIRHEEAVFGISNGTNPVLGSLLRKV